MKIEPGQIWEKDYSPDFHYLPVRVKILQVDSEKIVSEVVHSSISTRPVGEIIVALLEGEDPLKYKTRFGWHLGVQNPYNKTLINNHNIN